MSATKTQFDVVDCDNETWLYLGSEAVAEFHATSLRSRQGLAETIAEFCNNYERIKAERDELAAILKQARLQIIYLHEKGKETGSGNAMLAAIDEALAKLKETK